MDISKVSDLNVLKALAYDEIVLLEQTQNNLKLLTARMAELRKYAAQQDDPKAVEEKSEAIKIDVKDEDDLDVSELEDLPESGK